LRTDGAILIVLFLALGAQLPHTAVVFHRMATAYVPWYVGGFNAGTGIDWIHAFVAAISIEMAVLLFVVRGRIWLSWLFAVSSVAMNMIYYWRGSWTDVANDPQFWGSVLWSAIIPIAIAFYSHELAEQHNAGKEGKESSLWRLQRWFGKDVKPTVVPAVVPAEVVPLAEPKGKRSPPKEQTLEEFAASVVGTGTTSVPVLTGKQVAVWNLMQEGLDDKQISEQLGISPVTVRGYRKTIKDKMITNGGE
jgi:DNA-binding CsgD family transcriptional regulator